MKKFIFTMLLGLSLLGATAGSVPVNSYAQSNADNFELTVAVKNPLGDKKEFKDILSSVLNAIMDIVLPVVIVMVIYSGFLYVIARGNPEAVTKAHKTLTWTLVGAAILLGAQLIATVLVDTVSNIGKDAGVTNSSSSRTNNVTSSNNVNTVNPVSNSNTSTASSNNGFSNNSNTNNIVNPANTAVINTGNTNNTSSGNTSGVSSGTNTGVSSGSVQTSKYYVNAKNGANLRSAPNLTASYKTQPYGTVLDVKGETNGFYNIYNSTGTTIVGYIQKDLLTLGNTAPSSSSKSSTTTDTGSITMVALRPSVFTSNGASFNLDLKIDKSIKIDSKKQSSFICSRTINGVDKGLSFNEDVTIILTNLLSSGGGSISLNSINKSYENGMHTCYIRYETMDSTKYSNKLSAFIGLSGDDYFRLDNFTAGPTSLNPKINFTSLDSFSVTSPVVRCQDSTNKFVSYINEPLKSSFKIGEKNSTSLKFLYKGVYYCTIQFNYGGREFLTKLLGITIN